MLVNISYSIDFDEVPKIVKGFLENDIHTELTGQVTEAVNEAICALGDKNENTVRAIQKVEQIREALVKLDMRLSDCANILKGYQRELLKEPDHHIHGTEDNNTDLAAIQGDLGKLMNKMREAEVGTTDR